MAGLADKGVLPTRMVGNQVCLPMNDVLACKAENRAKRLDALAALSALIRNWGCGDHRGL